MATESESPSKPGVGDFAGVVTRLASPEAWLRLAAYGLVVGLVFGAFWLARADSNRVGARSLSADAPADAGAAPEMASSAAGSPTEAPGQASLPLPDFVLLTDPGTVTRLAEVHTFIPTRPRYQVVTYTVEKNDTLFIIADKFNLEPETILWGNPNTLADNPNLLSVGETINILPTDGALRVVQPGDTLEKIARVFHGNVDDIVNYPGNDLDPSDPQLKDGQYIIIPDGWRDPVVWQLPIISRSTRGRGSSGEPGACPGPFFGPTGSYTFIWPANNHYLSGTDYLPVGHPGIDIAAGMGAPIYASDTGVIVFAGWSTRGYGNLIIVDHGNGWQTAYAHLSQINVVCGQGVFQGNLIGLSGSTGNSSGAHLHFEMRSDQYGRVNPWLFLSP